VVARPRPLNEHWGGPSESLVRASHPFGAAQDHSYAPHQRHFHRGLHGAHRRLDRRRGFILGFKLDARSSAIVALAALTGMALYNTVSNRLRDRGDLGDQIADCRAAPPTSPARWAEMSRRMNAMETRVESSVTRSRGAFDPIGGRDRRTGRARPPDRRNGGGAETALQGRAATPARDRDAGCRRVAAHRRRCALEPERERCGERPNTASLG